MNVSIQHIIRPLAIRGLLLREWLQSRVTYNPLARAYLENPYPTYARVRRRDPVHWSPVMQAWIISRYEDVDAILRDHRRFSNDDRNATQLRIRRRQASEGVEPPRSMLGLDPPDHTRLRGLVTRAFTPRAVEALRPRIRQIVDGLIESMPEDEPFDLMEAFAYPLPVTVIAELIGVPAEDRADFKRWSGPVARTLEPTITQAEWEEAQEAERALDEYFERVIAERRDAPHEDLLSALILAEDAGEKLSHDELLVTLKLLLIAGNETTTNLIGNGMLALLRHPAQLDRLRDNPVLLESAIEELLRYDGPVQIDARWALQDVELRGKRILKGQGVIPLIGSANRDPRFFAEPRKLDIGREPNHHVAFGRGIHHCLGAPLARLEGQVAFQAFLEAFDRVALATDKPEFRDNVVLRGLRSLPLRVHRS